ncbi:hypothetical protein ACIRVF_14195 [Kitasatospora sp. NPDC101157]|uniref:hypothetical protein n=1 Tax=Kitasatospora sp. NPDC101157 TaxID=3364098 RepID=UPI0038022900
MKHTYYALAGGTPVLMHNERGLRHHASPEKQAFERKPAQQRGVTPTVMGDDSGLRVLRDALDGETDFRWVVVRGSAGDELRAMPAYAGGGAGNWPRIELAHTVLAQPDEVAVSAGSRNPGNGLFPTTVTNWSGHFKPDDELPSIGESAFERAGIDVMAVPRSLMGQ